MHYDHIVVGAGIVGLNAALELRERYPGQRVLVLERSLFPFGASTRNAGFACMGSLTELLDDLGSNSAAEVVALFRKRKEGLDLLRNRLGDQAIGYAARGSYELILPGEMPLLAQLDSLNEMLLDITGTPAFKRSDEKIASFGFPRQQVAALVENTTEGELHTGMMMRTLTDRALQKGVEIKTGAEATGYEEAENAVTVFVSDPVRKERIGLQCSRLYICTNAFSRQLLPGAEVQPGRGQVLITEPVPDLPFRGIFHFDKGYYYFREIEGRILFGGGRNLDRAGETTTEIGLHEGIQADLEDKLRRIILPGREVKVAQRWAGIMAFGPAKHPIIQQFSPRVSGAFRMGGMGVALGALAARELVNF
jgi:glycine/D-amino acid oxidase-like deaminating enzyme